jgi:hypothetical protein
MFGKLLNERLADNFHDAVLLYCLFLRRKLLRKDELLVFEVLFLIDNVDACYYGDHIEFIFFY